jgi:competence ComEA-like helix-hairpin-helix protein
MQTREGQRLGALVVLVASLVLYGGQHLSNQCTVREAPLPWGNQGPRMVAVEIVGDGAGEGIYFFQGKRTLKEHLKIAGMEEKFDLVDIPDVVAPEGSAISISAEGGGLKIRELAASKRLALNLAVDVNDVSEEELLLIPGIGIKLAARIVQLRRERGGFEDISDLTAVEGIKGKKLNDLRKYLTVKKTP